MEQEQVSETGSEVKDSVAETAGSTEEAAQAAPKEVEGSSPEGTEEEAVEPIQDAEGKKFIPYEVFEKRISKLTAQKKESEELLTALRTDPEVRKQFIKELGETDSDKAAPATEAPEQEEATPIASWLQGLGSSPEHQSFYKQYTEAILQTVDNAVTRYVQKELESRLGKELAPVKAFIGESSLQAFKSKAPDFNKYESKVAQLMKSKQLSLDEAYKLARYDDMQKELSSVKGGKSSSQVSQNREKLNKTPIAQRQTLKLGTSKSDKYSLDDAISETLREFGK